MSTESKDYPGITMLVVPCFNEAGRLEPARFLHFARHTPAIHFCFVNDGSNDATLGLLQDLQRQNPDAVRILNLERNVGKAEAVRLGILHAVQPGVEFIGYWDADLATPLPELTKFLAVLRHDPNICLAMGARVRLLGSQIERSLMRHYAGRIFATCASLALGIDVYDTQCGAKLFRVDDDVIGVFQNPFRGRWSFDVEVIMRLISIKRPQGNQQRRNPGIAEVPLSNWRDVPGSKIRVRDGIVALFDLTKLWWQYR